jgi:hypothetical protein
MMKRISTRLTPFIRWCWLPFVAAFSAGAIFSAFRGEDSALSAVAVLAFMALISWKAWVFQVRLWDVWLTDQSLHLRRGSASEEVALETVETVSYTHLFGVGEIVFEPTAKGRRILWFVPRMFIVPYLQRPPAVKQLEERLASIKRAG